MDKYYATSLFLVFILAVLIPMPFAIFKFCDWLDEREMKRDLYK